jgi:hypothetical protein
MDGYGETRPPECSENVSPRKVEHDGIRVEGRHGVEHLGARLNRGDLVALTGEEVLQEFKQRAVIVGDQDAASRRLDTLRFHQLRRASVPRGERSRRSRAAREPSCIRSLHASAHRDPRIVVRGHPTRISVDLRGNPEGPY